MTKQYYVLDDDGFREFADLDAALVFARARADATQEPKRVSESDGTHLRERVVVFPFSETREVAA
jgi:hypothetical protein